MEEREIQRGYKGRNTKWKRGRYREDTKGGIEGGREGDTERIQREEYKVEEREGERPR